MRHLLSLYSPFRRARSRCQSRPTSSFPLQPSHFTLLRLEPLEDRRMLSVYAVNSLADVVADDGLITLREALEAANTNTAVYDAPAGSATEPDTIIIFAQDPVDNRITLDGEQLEILDDVEIYGPGPDLLAIDAAGGSRVFYVAEEVEASLWGMTITGGVAEDYIASHDRCILGGGILNIGTLSITDSTISGNSANCGNGGGIYSFGTLTLRGSVISDNTLQATTNENNGGGGIYNAGTATIVDSLISDNSLDANCATSHGGGICNENTMTIVNSIIRDNSVKSGGGGIYNRGEMTISESLVSANSAYCGGGIFNAGRLVVADSTVSDNFAESTGGGIENTCSIYYPDMELVYLTIVRSTISNNVAEYAGGGIDSEYCAVLIVNESLISGNTAGEYGGGINRGSICIVGGLTITNSTISGNSATQAGGGIANVFDFPYASLINSTVVNNWAGEQGGGIFRLAKLNNCVVAINDAPVDTDLSDALVNGSDHNFIGAWSGETSPGSESVWGTPEEPLDPMLGPLEDNGGPTLTHAPRAGSPLIDSGNESIARDVYGFTLVTDQRGASRKHENIDIGAVEFQPSGIPVAYSDAIVTDQDESITFDILANDVFSEEAPIEVILLSGPEYGEIEQNPDGTLTYTPQSMFWGTDRFTYQIVNGELESNTVEVVLSVLSPTNIIVTTAEDVCDGDTSPEDICLREALALATPGTAIQFSADLVGQVIMLSDPEGALNVHDVDIIGPGEEYLRICIVGQYGFCSVSDDSRISGITIDGWSDSGIIVSAEATLEIDHVHFVGGHEENWTDQRGGIYAEVGSTVTVTHSVMWANALHRGVINCDGTVMLNDCLISNNLNDYGILVSNSGVLTIVDSILSNNICGGIGNSGTITLVDSIISHNGRGVSNSGMMTIVNSIISYIDVAGVDNVGMASIVSSTISNTDGCGVYNKGTLNIIDSIISDNASAGNFLESGGIYNSDGILNIANSIISGNSYWHGRGIRNHRGELNINNSTISDNIGGGISNNYGTLNIADSTISGNSASFGSGIYNLYGEVTIHHTTISGNTATMDNGSGGGIQNYCGNLTITDSTISDNSTGGNGGGIHSNHGAVNIANSTISGNSANGSDAFGGGIFIVGELTVTNSTISNNSSRLDGGGIASSGGISITDSIISNNSTGSAGGGIASYSGAVNIANSTISGNSANGSDAFGGGIFIVGELTVTNSTISGNSSDSCGGGIIIHHGNLSIMNSVIVGNTAGEHGGGILFFYPHDSVEVTITSSTITANTAGIAGGGIHATGGNLVLANTILSLNEAPSSADLYGILAAGSGAVMLGMDPGFVRNPDDGGDGWGDDPATAEIDESANDDYGNLHLRKDSPAVNAGSNALAVDVQGNPLATDRDGKQRIIYDVVDIGAYEFCLPADANSDGTVDDEDMTILSDHWGMSEMSWSEGDFNLDGQVNAVDASILAANWGATFALPSGEDASRLPARHGLGTRILTPNTASQPLVGPVQADRSSVTRRLIVPASRTALLGEPAVASNDAAWDATNVETAAVDSVMVDSLMVVRQSLTYGDGNDETPEVLDLKTVNDSILDLHDPGQSSTLPDKLAVVPDDVAATACDRAMAEQYDPAAEPGERSNGRLVAWSRTQAARQAKRHDNADRNDSLMAIDLLLAGR